jgi:hypothetical protein
MAVIVSIAFAASSRVDLQSVLKLLELSVLSADALDGLLSSASFVIDSEDEMCCSRFCWGFRICLLFVYHIRREFLSAATITALSDDSALCNRTKSHWLTVYDRLAHRLFNSLIVPNILLLFEEFWVKHFKLLWQTSGDGFGVAEFRRGCDGHAKTLTLILDTDGNLFGGFTPVECEWESGVWKVEGGRWKVEGRRWKVDGSNCLKGGDNVRNFLFTLKNPRAVPAQKITLRADKKYEAIICNSAWGSLFTGCIDVYNVSNANANTGSCIRIGTHWNALERIRIRK